MYETLDGFVTERIKYSIQGEFIEESDTLNTLSFLGLKEVENIRPERVKKTALVTFPSPIGFKGNLFKKTQVVKDDNLFWKLSEYQQSMLSGNSFGWN